MSLNREKILNELGDVMNQLQSADCGCMDSLFTPSPAQGMAVVPGMGRCCGHPGCHNTQPMQHTQSMPMPTNASQVLGACNPAQLYNETYNYLNENLVKPVVQEVYQDLKSLTPENTMANNPLAQQIIGANCNNTGSTSVVSPSNQGMLMGQGNTALTNPAVGKIDHNMGGTVQNQMMGGGGQDGMANQVASMGQNQIIGGGENQVISESAQRMGQNWVNMMLGDSKKNPAQGMSAMPDISAMATEMMANGVPQMGAGAPQQVSENSPTGGEIPPMKGGAPSCTGGMPQMTNPNNLNVTQPENSQHHPLAHMSQMANMAQMPQSMQQSQSKAYQYGINEFNKMFPQIQEGGDLGFNPMALAMQMNPNNQAQATIGAMHTMAHGLAAVPQTHSNAPHANAPQTYANTPQSYGNTPQTYANDANKEINNNYSNYNNDINNNNISEVNNNGTSRVPLSLMVSRNGLTPQDQVPYSTWTHHQYHQTPPQGQTNPGQQNNQWQQQAGQFYDQQNPLQQQYQEAATAAATIVPAAFGHAPASTICRQKVVKEPILPVVTSNIRYNTLGQPYEVIPEHMIHRPNFPLPQTLSPTPPPVKPMKFGTVKSTISKTMLAEMKPVGKQPSKSQLQQIYKQYRGSNSYPNLGGVVMPYKEKTNHPIAPLENVGDVSNTKEITIKLEQVDGDQIGDGPLIKKIVEEDDGTTPLHNGRRRNGLQDVVSTQYICNKSPKWSFHGDTHVRPHYTTYRFKPKN